MAEGFCSKFKYVFMFCNTLIIAVAIFGFIWGNINYNTNWNAMNGSFVGGQLATISVALIIYGMFGLYGSFKKKYHIITSYGLIALVSLLLRVLTWFLAWLNGYKLDPMYYIYLILELILVILSFIVMRAFKHNHTDN